MKIQEVARRARVSTATVSRTINNPSLVDPKTAKRVWKAIEELRYYRRYMGELGGGPASD